MSGLPLVLAVAAGAAVGAPCRYLLDRAVQRRLGPEGADFPWGLVVVNLLGSLVLGLLTGLAAGVAAGPGGGRVPAAVIAAGGTGWCGAFTTYSSFGYEAVRLARGGRRGAALLSVLLTTGGGLAAVAAGYAAGYAAG